MQNCKKNFEQVANPQCDQANISLLLVPTYAITVFGIDGFGEFGEFLWITCPLSHPIVGRIMRCITMSKSQSAAILPRKYIAAGHSSALCKLLYLYIVSIIMVVHLFVYSVITVAAAAAADSP